ncbi:MAG: cobyrinate a,c-diamide synthase [Thermoguttaceae bacterium]
MNDGCPRLVIAGTGSGVGKTSLTLGLARLFARQGMRVQTFKVGPDFLDPTYLAMASGRTCYNLDGWMTSRDYVRQMFARATNRVFNPPDTGHNGSGQPNKDDRLQTCPTGDGQIALVEGVMGLFDGASPTTLEGSTAEIARWLDAPVLLVAGVHGVARSLAATVEGFARFEPGVCVAGVIANQGGSPRHGAWLAESLAGAGAAPLVGMVPRGSLPTLPSRHLGLVTADAESLSPAVLDQLADACEKHLNVPLLLELARSAGPLDVAGSAAAEIPVRSKVRMGIARDAAFHFYYPDNLEAMTESGAEWVPFSPLADMRLPADLDGLYFGGGYPEVYADRLAANAEMLADVRSFAASGRAIYAECGGLMYLGRALTDIDGVRYPLAGVLPIETAMLEKLRVLGYTEVAWAADCLWGRAGEVARGHEFHYSRITADFSPAEGWRPAYSLGGRRASSGCEGFVKGRLQAGYAHLHWASRPEAIGHFLSCCEERS